MLTPVSLSGPGMGLFNRAPYSFFAPEVEFASQDHVKAAADEIRQLIRGLHKEGIEVYLQVRWHAFAVVSIAEGARSVFKPAQVYHSSFVLHSQKLTLSR